ncbi:MAG: hypothetical protein DMD91_16275 [Candidatus Rokuibacteriota bacterium]|nr:MAG: hypothetical protein DMD91_16275 [Candidatus Rokubacteria bacterium]
MVATGQVMTAFTVARAWADHGGGLRGAPTSPWLQAVLWGVAALVVGLAIVAIVNVVARRRSRYE